MGNLRENEFDTKGGNRENDYYQMY